MMIPYRYVQRAIELATNDTRRPVHIYAGVRYAGEYGIDQRGQWAVTRAERPAWCPPGQPFLHLATVRDTGAGVEIVAGLSTGGRDHDAR